MKLATARTSDGTTAVRVEDDGTYTDLGFADVGALLAASDWQARAAAGGRPLAGATGLAPVVPRPGKIVCVGLNYRNHIIEMGRDVPEHPTIFAKWPEALIGPHDDIALPQESDEVDWEAELVVVVGAAVRRASESEAAAAIAGFTVMNDVSVRDWQSRTLQWLQGKTFEALTPLGPVLVTPDEVTGGTAPELGVRCVVNGEVMQESNTSELVFGPVDLVRYLSDILTLQPGDVIATGTPGGVGHARKPPVHLTPGDTLVTEVDGLGRLENAIVSAP